MRKLFVLLGTALLGLSLTGCSAAAFWLSGCGEVDADVVVINESGRAVYSIVLEYAGSTEAVQRADGGVLLEQGQSYGLELEENEAVVILLDRAEQTIGRSRVTRDAYWRTFLTFDGTAEGSSYQEERR